MASKKTSSEPASSGGAQPLPNWKKAGVSYALQLQPGVVLGVDQSLDRAEGYFWSVLGVNSAPKFKSAADAQLAAEAYARKALAAAWAD